MDNTCSQPALPASAALLRRLSLFLLMVATASFAPAAIIGAQSLEIGGGAGRFDDPRGDTDLYSYFGRYNHPLGKLLFFETDIRAEYSESKDDSAPQDITWRDGDLDLLLSLKILIFKPYAIVGASYDQFDSRPPLFGSSDWKWGYNLGVGIELAFIPMLKITPAARYTKAGDTETIKYSLDVSVWFSHFGVGATGIYHDVRNSEVSVQQGVLYAAFRF
jgi:opacity protein-like surface antigen